MPGMTRREFLTYATAAGFFGAAVVAEALALFRLNKKEGSNDLVNIYDLNDLLKQRPDLAETPAYQELVNNFGQEIMDQAQLVELTPPEIGTAVDLTLLDRSDPTAYTPFSAKAQQTVFVQNAADTRLSNSQQSEGLVLGSESPIAAVHTVPARGGAVLRFHPSGKTEDKSKRRVPEARMGVLATPQPTDANQLLYLVAPNFEQIVSATSGQPHYPRLNEVDIR